MKKYLLSVIALLAVLCFATQVPIHAAESPPSQSENHSINSAGTMPALPAHQACEMAVYAKRVDGDQLLSIESNPATAPLLRDGVARLRLVRTSKPDPAPGCLTEDMLQRIGANPMDSWRTIRPRRIRHRFHDVLKV